MNRIESLSSQLLEMLVKEISGFVMLFGEQIDLESQQQKDACVAHFESEYVKHVDISKMFPKLEGELKTGDFKRIAASKNAPTKTVFLGHTWSSREALLDDLLLIHKAFQKKLDEELYRLES